MKIAQPFASASGAFSKTPPTPAASPRSVSSRHCSQCASGMQCAVVTATWGWRAARIPSRHRWGMRLPAALSSTRMLPRPATRRGTSGSASVWQTRKSTSGCRSQESWRMISGRFPCASCTAITTLKCRSLIRFPGRVAAHRAVRGTRAAARRPGAGTPTAHAGSRCPGVEAAPGPHRRRAHSAGL